VELARWRIETDSVALGHLVHLEIQDRLGPIRYYRVENAAGEWVGHVSDQLRFSRRVPFAEHEEVLGTYSMREGLGWLFATQQSPQLVPVATEAVFSGAAESGARDAVGTGPRRLK